MFGKEYMGVLPLPAANRNPQEKILSNIMVFLVCQTSIIIRDQPFQNILEHDVIEWTYVTSFKDDYILLLVTLSPSNLL